MDDWRAGREIRVAFGPRAGPLKVSEVYAAEEEVVKATATLGSYATFTLDETGQECDEFAEDDAHVYVQNQAPPGATPTAHRLARRRGGGSRL